MTLAEAKAFLKKESEYLGLGFHPDTPFEDYIDSRNGQTMYCEEKAAEYNQLMEQAMDAFDEAGEDLYEYCLTLL